MRRRAKITKVGRREAAVHSGNVDEHPDSEPGSVDGGDGNEIGGNPQDADDGASDDNMSEGSVRGGGSEDEEDGEEDERDGMIPDDDNGAGSDGIDD